MSDDDLVAGELRIGGRERSFTVRLPQAPPDDRPVPLALVLHGRNAGGRMALRIRFSDATRTRI